MQSLDIIDYSWLQTKALTIYGIILRTSKRKFLQGHEQSNVSNGAFLWDVTALEEHRFSTIGGEIHRLCNSPTYASRHGYRLCLWVYLGGDNSREGAPICLPADKAPSGGQLLSLAFVTAGRDHND